MIAKNNRESRCDKKKCRSCGHSVAAMAPHDKCGKRSILLVYVIKRRRMLSEKTAAWRMFMGREEFDADEDFNTSNAFSDKEGKSAKVLRRRTK